MFRNVLVAMDLSPATEAIVSALPGLRELGTEEVRLIHVAKPFRDPVSRSLRDVEQVRERLRGLADRLAEGGIRVRVDVPAGAPAQKIVETAEEQGSDVILVGTRSHTRIREAFLGSVAWEVVRRSKRPVLLQRIEPNRRDPEAALEAQGRGLPRHVIHPTDFSGTAERALPYLSELARRGVPSFTVAHILSKNDIQERDAARARLEELAAGLRNDGVENCRVLVRVGTPHEEILNAGGRDLDALVVMGTQGRGVLPEIVMGSVSRQVVRYASARVLLVPDGGSD